MKTILASLFCSLLLLQPVSSRAHDIDNSLLATIGSSGAIVVYNTYQLLELTMEAYSGDLIDKQRSLIISQTQIELMKISATQHRNILESKALHVEADKKAVEDIANASESLKEMAIALQTYVEENNSDNLATYEAAADTAWQKVKQLLGLP